MTLAALHVWMRVYGDQTPELIARRGRSSLDREHALSRFAPLERSGLLTRNGRHSKIRRDVGSDLLQALLAALVEAATCEILLEIFRLTVR